MREFATGVSWAGGLPGMGTGLGRLLFLNPFYEIIVFANNVIPIFYTGVVFGDKVVTLGDELADIVVLLLDIAIGAFEFPREVINRLLVISQLHGLPVVHHLQFQECAFLLSDDLRIGLRIFLIIGKARVQVSNLVVRVLDGVGGILQGGVSIGHGLRQLFNFTMLNRLNIPLIGAQTAQADREAD